MFERNEINLENQAIELGNLEKVKGEFETDQGKKIPYRMYKLKVKINGVVFKFKLEKAFNDTMDEIIEEFEEE